MRTVTVRLPDSLAAEIDVESRRRRISKSDVVRERLEAGAGYGNTARSGSFDRIADLVGSVDALSPDLSARKKQYLKAAGYGRKRPR